MNDVFAVEHPKHLYFSEHSFLHYFILVSFLESFYCHWKVF